MNSILRAVACALAAAAITPGQVCAGQFVDPLDAPAQASPLASRALLNGLAHAGDRVVAVGQRGHILYSDDGGEHWTQGRVPLATDLVSVRFVSASEGWAVGHDGVVLHSDDGGARWQRQFDGRRDPAVADKPLLDIWFDGQGHGYAVGSFGLLLRSEDDGRSWQHWESHADNPQGLHLNGIRAVGEDLYIVGEQGLLLKRRAADGHFAALSAPYQGSYFGLVGKGDTLVVFGLRGTALYSTDGGAHWQPSRTGTQTGLIDGALLDDGSVLLLTQSGQLLRSHDGGVSFRPQADVPPGPASALLLQQKAQLLIVGTRGVRKQALASN